MTFRERQLTLCSYHSATVSGRYLLTSDVSMTICDWISQVRLDEASSANEEQFSSLGTFSAYKLCAKSSDCFADILDASFPLRNRRRGYAQGPRFWSPLTATTRSELLTDGSNHSVLTSAPSVLSLPSSRLDNSMPYASLHFSSTFVVLSDPSTHPFPFRIFDHCRLPRKLSTF